MYEVPCPEENILLEDIGELSLVQLGRPALPDFFEFVFGVFKAQFGMRFKVEITTREYEEFIADETSFAGNGMYAALLVGDPPRIVGGFRAVRYSSEYEFPTERVFGISVPELAMDLNVDSRDIWHGGCFAMDTRWLMKRGYKIRQIVRRIYYHSLASMLKNGAYAILGETDELIERLHAHNGFIWRPISDWAEYWGPTRATMLNVAEAAAGKIYCEELQAAGFFKSEGLHARL